jgi:hypothetical protein
MGGIIVWAAVDLPNAGCVIGTITLWPAWVDLLDWDTLLRMDGSRRMTWVVWIKATAI